MHGQGFYSGLFEIFKTIKLNHPENYKTVFLCHMVLYGYSIPGMYLSKFETLMFVFDNLSKFQVFSINC